MTTVLWVCDFPIEWLPDVPEPLRRLPKRHPATWQMVLLEEFEKEASLRVHVALLRSRIERSFSFERKGITFHVLKAPGWARLSSVFWLDTLLLRRLCRQIEPNLIHAWGIEKGAAVIAHRLGYPYVLTVQGLLAWYKERVPLGAYYGLMERLERIYLPRAPLVTTESTFAVQFLQQRYPQLPVQQAEHAPNRVFFNVPRHPATKPVHVISIGGLGFRKGTDLLFGALARLGPKLDFTLTIISDPAPGYLDEMKAKVPGSLWQRTVFKHDLLPNEVARELETPTMLLLPTRADTSPNAVKEAVVAGLPVIASNIGGIPDYVFPGKNGLLFTAGDLADFMNAIQQACAHPLFSRGEVEAETLARTRAYLAPARMAQNFLAAYGSLADSAIGRGRSVAGRWE